MLLPSPLMDRLQCWWSKALMKSTPIKVPRVKQGKYSAKDKIIYSQFVSGGSLRISKQAETSSNQQIMRCQLAALAVMKSHNNQKKGGRP